MSTKRWVFLGVTLVSAVAYLVDRMFFSAPAAAVADSPIKTASQKNKAATPANAVPEVELADPSLAYLDKLPPLGFQRDVFAPTPAMLKHYQQLEEEQNKEEATAGPKPGSPEAFETEHQLQATFTGPNGAVAVVNDKMLRLGEELAGFRLTKIGAYHAEFQRGDERISLYIPSPDSPAEKTIKKPDGMPNEPAQ